MPIFTKLPAIREGQIWESIQSAHKGHRVRVEKVAGRHIETSGLYGVKYGRRKNYLRSQFEGSFILVMDVPNSMPAEDITHYDNAEPEAGGWSLPNHYAELAETDRLALDGGMTADQLAFAKGERKFCKVCASWKTFNDFGHPNSRKLHGPVPDAWYQTCTECRRDKSIATRLANRSSDVKSATTASRNAGETRNRKKTSDQPAARLTSRELAHRILEIGDLVDHLDTPPEFQALAEAVRDCLVEGEEVHGVLVIPTPAVQRLLPAFAAAKTILRWDAK